MANAVTAKGNASFIINPQQTEARLIFAPDPDGSDWDAAAINKLASEKTIVACPDPKALESFLAKAAKAKSHDSMEMVFASGINPEEPQPEKINWEALPVPGDMAAYQKESLSKAGNPEIIVVKVEKIKHEDKVKKSGALPFKAAKDEITVSWEKKETREKIDVNPKVLDVKYADRGIKLGSITPSIPGKPGKSIFGRPVPPKEAMGNSCFFGKGIRREKNDFFAEFSGFVRIGETWADIAPFAKHVWKISSGTDGITMFLRFEPGDKRFTPPTGKEILAAALEKGCSEKNLIDAIDLDKAIGEAMKTGEMLDSFSLFRTQEAEAIVQINSDRTKVTLFLRKGLAGALPLEMKVISQAIKTSGIRGYDAEKLKTAIHTFIHGKDVEFSYALAEGTPSTRGTDREVKVLAALLSGEEHKGIHERINEWQSRDALRETSVTPDTATGYAFVKEGDVIAKVTEGGKRKRRKGYKRQGYTRPSRKRSRNQTFPRA